MTKNMTLLKQEYDNLKTYITLNRYYQGRFDVLKELFDTSAETKICEEGEKK